jgi:NADH:ubiquinone oxidoreductase subunit 4 (subunit M)
MNMREIAAVLPLVVFLFVLGLFPNIIFDKVNPSTAEVVSIVQGEQATSFVAD